MSNPVRRTIFRVSGVSSAEGRSHARVRVLTDGRSSFDLSLPMLHQIDEWAAGRSPQVSRTEAIDQLIRQGLQFEAPRPDEIPPEPA